jgi:DnaJ-class molecular chaperone
MKINPCRYCKGTCFIKWEGGEHECTSCNGIGIDGNSRGLIIFMLLWILTTVAAAIYLIRN